MLTESPPSPYFDRLRDSFRWARHTPEELRPVTALSPAIPQIDLHFGHEESPEIFTAGATVQKKRYRRISVYELEKKERVAVIDRQRGPSV